MAMVETEYQTESAEDGQLMSCWSCPCCSHSLTYGEQHEGAAKLAMVSHLVGCHQVSYWQVRWCMRRQGIEDAADEYFAGRIW